MAHELLIENGKAAMFYVGGRPWHGLGTALEAPPTAEEAIQAANLSWEVVKAPLYVSGVGRLLHVPNRFALVRRDQLDRDDCPIFGVVGSDYEPLQNREAFAFFDQLVEQGRAEYHTAGALGRGERIWVLAKLSHPVSIGGDDLEPFVLLSNTHDGTGSVSVKLTPVRVVCQNTLSVALRGSGRSWRVRHTGTLVERLEEVQLGVENLLKAYDELGVVFNRMRETPLPDADLVRFIDDVFPMSRVDTSRASRERVEKHRALARHLAQNGTGNTRDGVRQTLWAGYNGVTDYVDHRKPARIGSDFNGRRLNYVWFGSGARVKQRALALAVQRLNPKFDPQYLSVDLAQ